MWGEKNNMLLQIKKFCGVLIISKIVKTRSKIDGKQQAV